MLAAHVFCRPASRGAFESAVEGVDAILFSDWYDYTGAAEGVALLAVILDPFDSFPALPDVGALRKGRPLVPFLLCTTPALAASAGPDFDVSVPLANARRGLRVRLLAYQFALARKRMADLIPQADHDLALLREPLARLMTLDSPPRLAGRAATEVGMTIGAVDQAFRKEVRPGGGSSFKRYVDSLVLFRACEFLRTDTSVLKVCASLGISEKTLRRMAPRAWDVSVGRLRHLGPEQAALYALATLGLDDMWMNPSQRL